MSLMKLLTFTFATAFVGQVSIGEEKDAVKATSISFSEGSAKLNDDDKESLRELVRAGLQKGRIEQVILAAWSDKAMPAEKQSLTDKDRGLAKERADMISDFLTMELEVTHVHAYNMAESASWISRTFRTKDAELKSIWGRTEIEAPKRAEFRAIRNQGRPSLAVVVVNQNHRQ